MAVQQTLVGLLPKQVNTTTGWPADVWSVRRIVSNGQPNTPEVAKGPWRPPQWSNQPQLTSITVTYPTESVSHLILDDQGQPLPEQATPTTQWMTQTYFFDAVHRIEHLRGMQATEHPVQLGAAVTDHVYQLPGRVTLDIGMSDVMDTYVHGQYTTAKSKSVSCYQTMVELQQKRIPMTLVRFLTLNTIQNSYNNFPFPPCAIFKVMSSSDIF
jgi:hypothetical protein